MKKRTRRENGKLKRTLAVMLMTLLTLGLLSGCGSSSSDSADESASADSSDTAEASEDTTDAAVPDKVTIGVQTLITPELIARYEEIYEEYLGTEVELVQFDSGADVNEAFAGGSIDIGSFGSAPAAISLARELGTEVFWYHDVIGTAESLAVREDSGITSIEDLVGKTVATPFASTSHYSLLNALSLAGVDASEVDLVDMQPDDIYAAWTRGDIDAAYVWNPVLGYLLADGGITITDSEILAEEGIVTADVCAVRVEFAEQYPDIVTAYVKAQLYALDVYYNDIETAVEEIAGAADIEVEEAADQVEDFYYPTGEDQITADYLGTSDEVGALAETLKATADFLVEQGSLDSSPDLEVFEAGVTGEFVEAALAE